MEEDKEAKFAEVMCSECGIDFAIPKKVDDKWRKTCKCFYCPNGHPLSYPKPKETEDQKEIKKLKAEIAELRETVAKRLIEITVANKEIEALKKKNEELANEIEIWKPSK